MSDGDDQPSVEPPAAPASPDTPSALESMANRMWVSLPAHLSLRGVSDRVAQVSPFRDEFELINRPVLAPPAGGVSHGIKVAAGWAWRILLLAALVYAVFWVLAYLGDITIPLFVAILLAAALYPMTDALAKRRVPRGLAAAISLVTMAVAILAIFTLVGAQIASQWDQLATATLESYRQLLGWLKHGPLHLEQTQLDAWLAQGEVRLKESQAQIASIAASAGAQIGHFFAGIALAMFACFYFLYQGPMIARSVFSIVPATSRPRVLLAAGRGWVSLVSYVRAIVVVAFVDGLGAGIGAAIVGSNLFMAIGALTFITAFIPLIGAFSAGTVATAVVLVTKGFWPAVAMLAIFILVMEVEAHVLQPFLLGRAVAIHPLAVLYGLAIGIVLGGIVGGLFTVPLMAFANAFIRALNSDSPAEEVGAGSPVVEDSDGLPVEPKSPTSPA